MDRVQGGKISGRDEGNEQANKRSSGSDREESSIYSLPFYGDSARRHVRTGADGRLAWSEERSK